MFWSSAHIEYLEHENSRLREENRLLLAALLNSAGKREAAHMLRNPQPKDGEVVYTPPRNFKPDTLRKEPSPAVKKQQEVFAGRAWRSLKSRLQRQSIPPAVAASSADALQARVEEKLNVQQG